RFDGAGPQGPGPRVPVAPVSCPCCFVDDAGVYHVVSEVPLEYLARAHRVSSDAVQVLPMPPPPLPPEETAEAPPPRRRAEAARPRPAQPQQDYYEYIRRITGQRGPQDQVN